MPKTGPIEGPVPPIQVGTASVDFGLVPAGVTISHQVEAVKFNPGSNPITVTLAMASGGNSGFTAELIGLQTLIHGGTSQSVIAESQGSNNTFVVGPAGASAGSSSPVPGESAQLTIHFTPPATPDPDTWSDTVVFSWQQGSATDEYTVPVSGGSAQFSASISSHQPIPLDSSGHGKVDIDIRYNSLDPSPITVGAQLAVYQPLPVIPGLTATAESVTMAATYLDVPGGETGDTKGTLPANPAKPVSVAEPFSPQKALIPFREATISVQVFAGVQTQPGDSQQAAFSISSTLPQAFDLGTLQVAFDIPPLPIKFSLPGTTQIYFLAGESASVTLQVQIEGASTTVNVGPPSSEYTEQIAGRGPGSGTAPLTIKWPSWVLADSGGTIQLADGETPFSISAPASAAGWAMVSLPWSAYGGELTGTYQFQVQILPQTVSFGGNFSYAELSGDWRWSLNYAGFSYFTGRTNWNGDPTDPGQYVLGAVLNVADATNNLLWVYNTGTPGGYWDNPGQWNGAHGWIDTTDPITTLATWLRICLGSTVFVVNYGEVWSSGGGSVIPITLNDLPPGATGHGIPTLYSQLSCTYADDDLNCTFS